MTAGLAVLRQLIFVHGRDVNVTLSDITPLMYSICSAPAALEFLLSVPEIDVNKAVDRGGHEHSITALMLAVEYKNEKAVEMLLSHPRVDVNHQCSEDVYVLSFACAMGLVDIVRLMLAHPNVDPCKSNALSVVINNCEPNVADGPLVQIFRMLLAHPRFDPNTLHNGETLLQKTSAWFTSSEACAAALIDCPRVDVNHRSAGNGLSALDWACISRKVSLVTRFLQRPDLDMRSVPGAVRLAQEHGFDDIVSMIKVDRAVRRAVRAGDIAFL